MKYQKKDKEQLQFLMIYIWKLFSKYKKKMIKYNQKILKLLNQNKQLELKQPNQRHNLNKKLIK